MITRNKGVTLIELMVVVAIIAIIAAIGYPSYREHTLKSNRTEGTRGLLETAQRLERCYSLYNAYNNANCPIANGAVLTPSSGEGYYQIQVVSAANTYALSAVPQGVQADDDCGTLTLNQAGVKGVGGSTVQNCW